MSEGKKILSKLLSSEVKGDLLVLFHKNPGIIDTMEGVARRIGRTTNATEEDVKELVGLGLLTIKRIGNYEVIFLNHTGDKEIQETIGDYLKGLKKERGVCDGTR